MLQSQRPILWMYFSLCSYLCAPALSGYLCVCGTL